MSPYPWLSPAAQHYTMPYLHPSPSYQEMLYGRQDQSRMEHSESTAAALYPVVSLYPTPAPQVSPPSGGHSSGYVDSPYPGPPTLSPLVSPPTDNLEENEEFLAFERNAMRAMALKNGGTLLRNNPRMRRTVHSTSQNASDDAYRIQRERNNLAAKQSRDRRKLREIHLALKVTYLNNTVAKLKAQLAAPCRGGCRRPHPT